jgi:DNA (cytosine-5)-methyltransferase 1
MTNIHPSTHKAISLFSGCGGDTLGLERAGFKVVAFNEFKKSAIDTHMLNFPESVLLTAPTGSSADITKVPDSVFEAHRGTIDIVFAGFPCFVAGTQVLTSVGYKSIEDVTLADTLLTHTGTFQSIVNLQKKLYSDDLYVMNIKYHPNDIVCTKEHPFYVRERRQLWNNTLRKYDITFGEPKWKNAADLTANDYFGMVINSRENIPEFVFEKKLNSFKKVRTILSLDDPDMWYMMGYFVGDGWIEDTPKLTGAPTNKIRFAINNKDEATVLPRIQRILPITDKKCDTGRCRKFGCADATWHKILKQFGKYSHGKIIPEWIQDAPKHFIQEFINGYMAADGNIYSNGRGSRITTVSYNLALGLQRLYLKLGHIASVNKSVRPPTHEIQGRTISQRDTYTVELILEKKRAVSSFIDNNYVWFASQSITKKSTEEPTPVYNFEVQTDNSYIVENTIVHNCQGFSSAGKRKAADPRNQMYLQFVRAVKAVKPAFFIGENVTGLVSMKSGPKEDDPLVLNLIKKAFADIGYDLTHEVLEATDFGVPQKRKRIVLVGWDTSRFPNFSAASFWAGLSSPLTGQAPKLRHFIKPSMDGAFEVPAANIPVDFPTYALPIPQDAQPEGAPHPYVKLKASASDETYGGKDFDSLLSCAKRDSPVHSEIIDLDAPSKTIICTYDHQPRLLVGLRKPDGTAYVRTLLPDELKQIQGFPADFKLSGNKKDQIVQVGNAVPPPMIQAVATQLKSLLQPPKIKVRRLITTK